MTIIETHYVDQSDLFIQLYNEGKSRKEILDTLQIGNGAYSTYLRDNKQHLQKPKIKCPVCGKTFPKKHNNHQYCSLECQKKVKNQRRKKHITYKTCPICGKQFKPNSSNHQYCTEECVKEVKRRYRRKYYQQNRETIIAKTQAYYQQKKKENGG